MLTRTLLLRSLAFTCMSTALFLGCGKTSEDNETTVPDASGGSCQVDTLRECTVGDCSGLQRCESGAWGACECTSGTGGANGSGGASSPGTGGNVGPDAGAGGASAGGTAGTGGVVMRDGGPTDAPPPVEAGPCGVPWSGLSGECWSCLCATCPAEILACDIELCTGEQLQCGYHNDCQDAGMDNGVRHACYRQNCTAFALGELTLFNNLDDCLVAGPSLPGGIACQLECDLSQRY